MWLTLFVMVIPTALAYYAPGQHVCYPPLGCFNHTYPFNNTDYLPDSPKDYPVKLKLFTQRNRQIPDILSYTDKSSLTSSHFDPENPLKVVIHGFLSRTTNNWVEDVKNEFVNHGDCNVLEVDWSSGAGFPYGQAVANTRLVAVQVRLLLTLMEDLRLDGKNIHIIGHSLGAHIAGDIGHFMESKIGRITALDSAGPNYENLHPLLAVDKSDAMFVDAIHTDGSDYDFLAFKGYGLMPELGHVDFYPNGGVTQPGCEGFFKDGFGKRQAEFASIFACAHLRSHEFFARSINPVCPFKSFPCGNYESYVKGDCTSCNEGDGCSSMGYHADKFPGRGKQYLRTTGKNPFCGYQYKVVATLELSPSSDGKLYIKLKGDTGFSTSAATLEMKQAKIQGQKLQGVIVVDRPIVPLKYIYARFEPSTDSVKTSFIIREFDIKSLDDGRRHDIIPGFYSVGGEKGMDMPVHESFSIDTIG